MHRFDCEKDIEDNKQPHLSMNLNRVTMYSKMVEDMLQMTKIQHDATLECKCEAFKKAISHAQTNVFRSTTHLGNTPRNVDQRKNGLINVK